MPSLVGSEMCIRDSL